MLRLSLSLLFTALLVASPAPASAAGDKAERKKAHDQIKKWVKAKKRKPKSETRLYDDMVRYGVKSKEVLKMMKTVIAKDLNIGSLSHFLRRRADAGVRGKTLTEIMQREVKARAEKKKSKRRPSGGSNEGGQPSSGK